MVRYSVRCEKCLQRLSREKVDELAALVRLHVGQCQFKPDEIAKNAPV